MIENYTLSVLVVVVLSYLMGSIPTAYLICKLHGVDIFKIGSGNMGATNVTRALGLRWGLFVMFLDILKGVIVIYLSRQLMPLDSKAAATTISALVVIVGHNWSLFATLLTGTLRGGKGAATAFGTLLMIAPVQVIVGMIVTGVVIVWVTRYVSLAVLATFAMSFLWMVVLTVQEMVDSWVMLYFAVMAFMIAVRFKGNIQRLLAGTERRLGESG